MDWSSCLADAGNGNKVATLQCIPIVFKNLISIALIFAGIVAVFFIIYSGIRFISSGGDPKQVDAARQTLTWAIVGLVLILLSFLIVNVIATITGTTCLQNSQFGFTNCG